MIGNFSAPPPLGDFLFLLIVTEVLSSDESDLSVVPCVARIFVVLFKKVFCDSRPQRFTSGVSSKFYLLHLGM